MAATGKILGTVTSVVGEVKATAADGTVRILQVGDVVHSDEAITTSAAGAVNVALENGKTLDCGANTSLSLHESILGVATAVTNVPGTPGSAAPGSVEALQQAIASGQDPSQVAPATAAGGAPAAGGVGGDGGGGSPVIIEQANTSSVVTSGFPTAGDTIAFPTPEFDLQPTGEPAVVVVTLIDAFTGLAADSVLEGQVIAVKAIVDIAPTGSPLVLTVSPSGTLGDPTDDFTVTIPVGETEGTFTFAAPSDDPYVDSGPQVYNIVGAQGGGYDSLSIGNSSVSVFVEDTIDTTTVSLTTQDVPETATSVSFQISLSNPPQGGSATAIVQVAGEEGTREVAIGANGLGSFTVNFSDDDVYNDGDTISATVLDIEGGNYEAVSVAGASDTATITEVIDTTTVSLTTQDVPETATSVSFQISLSNPPQGGSATAIVQVAGEEGTREVAIGANGLGSFTVNFSDDDVYNDGDTISATVLDIEGGNYEAVSVAGASDTATITEVIDTTLVSLTTQDVPETATSVSFQISLSNPPQGGSATAIVQVAGEEGTREVAIDANGEGSFTVALSEDDVYSETGESVSASVIDIEGGNYEAVSVDGASATAQITEVVDTTTVSLTTQDVPETATSVSFQISLSNPPQGGSATAIVQVAGEEGTREVAIGANGLGSFTVNFSDDDVYNDGDSISATVLDIEGGNYEAVSVEGASDTATITEVIDTTLVSLTTEDVPETAESVTFHISLSNPPEGGSGTATVQVAGEQGTRTVAIDANGEGSFTVALSEDDVYSETGESVSATVTAVNGNFEALNFDDASATAQITEVVDTTTVSLTTQDVPETATSVSFQISLSNPPQGGSATAIVQVAGEEGTREVAIGANGLGSFTVNFSDDDVYNDGDSISATVLDIEGGNYEAVSVEGASDTATITEVIDTTLVSLTTEDVPETAESVTFHISLSNPPEGGSGTATVQVAGEQGTRTVAIDANGEGSFTVALSEDDVYSETGESVSATVTAVNGNFEALNFDDASATAQITEVVDTTTVSLTTQDVPETATSVSFQISLSNPPQGGSATAIVQVAGEEGTREVAIGANGLGSFTVNFSDDDVYNDGDSISATVLDIEGGNYEAVSVEGASDTATITEVIDTTLVSLTTEDVPETAESVTFHISLSNPPEGGSGTATVQVAGEQGTRTVAIDANGEGSFTVALSEDDVYSETGESVSATVTAVNGNFEALNFDDASATAQITEVVDTTTVSLTTQDVPETATSVSFQISLSNPPQGGSATAIVQVAGEEGTREVAIGANGLGSFTVNFSDDDVYNDGDSISATVLDIEGGNYEAVSVEGASDTATITEVIDTTTVTLDDVAADEGGNIVYTAHVDNAPQGDLVITLNDEAQTTITISSGQFSGTSASVPAPNAPDGGAEFVVGISGTTGGNYEARDITDTALVTITDNTPSDPTDDDIAVEEESIPGIGGNDENDGLSYTTDGSFADNADWGSDGFGGIVSIDGIEAVDGVITVNGPNAAWTLVVQATGPDAGDYTFTMLKNLSSSGSDEDTVDLPSFAVLGQDSDGSEIGFNLNVGVVDDVPALDVTNGIIANQSGGVLAGTLVSMGADGGAASDAVVWNSIVTKINGVTETLTSLGEDVVISMVGNTITGTTSVANGSDPVFTIVANADGTYSVNLSRSIDTSKLFPTDGQILAYGDGNNDGYYLYAGTGDTLLAFDAGEDPDPTKTLLATFTATGGAGGNEDQVSLSTSGMGVGGNTINGGDTIFINLADTQQFSAVKISVDFYSAGEGTFTAYYSDGTDSGPVAIAPDGAGDLFIQAKAGTFLEQVDISHTGDGNQFKIDGMNFFLLDTARTPTLDLGFTAEDGDGDTVNGTVVVALDSSDPISGSTGNLALGGSSGENQLVGGTGDDILTGGAGDDILDGGTGRDTFNFASDSDGVDSIASPFTIGTSTEADVLNLRDVLGSNATLVGAVGADDVDAVKQYIYFEVNGATATLHVDTDGEQSGPALATFSHTGTDADALLTQLLQNNQIVV